jgi:hypothetical protein
VSLSSIYEKPLDSPGFFGQAQIRNLQVAVTTQSRPPAGSLPGQGSAVNDLYHPLRSTAAAMGTVTMFHFGLCDYDTTDRAQNQHRVECQFRAELPGWQKVTVHLDWIPSRLQRLVSGPQSPVLSRSLLSGQVDDPIGFNKGSTQQQNKRPYQEDLFRPGYVDIPPCSAGYDLFAVRIPKRELE